MIWWNEYGTKNIHSRSSITDFREENKLGNKEEGFEVRDLYSSFINLNVYCVRLHPTKDIICPRFHWRLTNMPKYQKVL